MASAQILGGGSGTLTLDDEVFGAPFNGPLVHECVVRGRAPPRHARHPHARHGPRRRRQAVAPEGHGPRPRRLLALAAVDGRRHGLRASPRHYIVKVNRKARRAALRAALSLHTGAARSTASMPRASGAVRRRIAAGLLSDRRGGRCSSCSGPTRWKPPGRSATSRA